MKQTNNAIKFLVAQYRAIFKNAYLKNLGVALAVTATLASASHAAVIPDKLGEIELSDGIISTGETIVADINNKNGYYLENGANTNSPIVINGGALKNKGLSNIYTKNDIELKSGSIEFSGTSDVGGLMGGFKTPLDSNVDSNITFDKSLTATGGSITIYNSNIMMKDISIGGNTTVFIVEGEAVWMDNAKLGAQGTFTLSDSAHIKLAERSQIVAQHINITGGTIEFLGNHLPNAIANNQQSAFIRAVGESNVNITGGELKVDNYDVGGIYATNINIAGGAITMNNDSTFVLAKDLENNSPKSTINMTSGTLTNNASTLIINGDATFAEGTLVNKGTVQLDVDDNDATSLTIAAADFNKSLNEAGAKYLFSGTTANNVDKRVDINVIGSEVVDLTSKIGADGAFTGDFIKGENVKTQQFHAENVTISKAKYSGTLAIEAANLKVGNGGSFTIGANTELKVTKSLVIDGNGSLNITSANSKLDLELSSGNNIELSSITLGGAGSNLSVRGGGALIISGDANAANNKYAGELEAHSVTLSKRGKIQFGEQSSKIVSFTGNNVAVEGIAQDAINNTEGTEAKFNLTGDYTVAQANKLREHVFSENDKGFINLGSANITDITDKIEGTGDSTFISFTNAQKSESITTDLLNDVAVKGVNGAVKGSYGSLITSDATKLVTTKDDLTLNNAANGNTKGMFVTNANGELGDLKIEKTITTLANGGAIGTVTTAVDTTLVIDSSNDQTSLSAIAGSGDVVIKGSAITDVAGDVAAKSLDIAKESTLNALGTGKSVTVEDADVVGNLTVNTLTAEKSLMVSGNTTVNDTLTIGKAAAGGSSKIEAAIDNGGSLAAKLINVADGAKTTIYVGNDEVDPGKSSTGYLSAERLNISGATLIADSVFGQPASIVDVDHLGDSAIDAAKVSDYQGGVVQGKLVSLQNAVIAVGATKDEVLANFGDYFDANKSLKSGADNLGSILYINKALKVANGAQIIIDSAKSAKQYQAAARTAQYGTIEMVIAGNSAILMDAGLAIDTKDSTGKQVAAIHFDKSDNNGDATIKAENGAKVVLTGSAIAPNKVVSLFSDKGVNQGVTVDGSLDVVS